MRARSRKHAGVQVLGGREKDTTNAMHRVWTWMERERKNDKHRIAAAVAAVAQKPARSAEVSSTGCRLFFFFLNSSQRKFYVNKNPIGLFT